MRKLNKLWLSLALILGFSVQLTAQTSINGVIVKPIESTAGNLIYYYIESAGNTGGPSGAPSSVSNILYAPATNGAIVRYDLKANITEPETNALWTSIKVTSGSVTPLLFKNKNGLYLNITPNPRTVVTAPPTAYSCFIPVPGATDQYMLITNREVNPLIAYNKSANGGNYLDQSTPVGANSRSAWYFVLPEKNVQLAIDNANGYIANTTQGTAPGYYPQAARTALTTAIGVAQQALTDGTPNNDAATTETLNQAIKAYANSIIAPKVSTLGSQEYYYAIKSTDRNNRALQDRGVSQGLWGADNAAPTIDNTPESQRWMLIQLADGTYTFVNKSTRHYVIHTDPANNSIIKPRTAAVDDKGWIMRYMPDQPNKFNFIRMVVGSGDKIQFHMSLANEFTNYQNFEGVGGKFAFIALDEATTKAATPTISVPAGNIQDGIEIEFTSATPDAKFYYTVNGDIPNALSPIATDNKITINKTTAPNTTFTLKVVAFANGFMNSEVAEAAYTITNVEVAWRGEAESGNWIVSGTAKEPWWYARWTGSEAQQRPDLASSYGASGTPRNVLINNNNQADKVMSINTGGPWLYINSLTFGSEATDPRTINDNGFVFNGVSTIVNRSTATHTINSGISVDNATTGPLTINAAAGNLVVNGVYWTNGNPTIVTGAKDVTIGGNLQQPGSITKQGTGTLIISGNNGSHEGSYTVEGGVLELTGTGAFNTATTFTVKNGATLRINRNLVLNNTTTIEAGGILEVAAGKQLTVGSNVTNNGTIILRSNATAGTATLVGNVSGTATVEQAAQEVRTYYIGSPVSGTGVGSANIGDYITFTESSDTWSTKAAFSGLTPDFGKGYGIQVAAGGSPGKDAVISFTGTLNNSPAGETIGMTKDKNQFNFLGNPYPSYLSAANVIAGGDIEGSLYFYTRLSVPGVTPVDYKFVTYNHSSGLTNMEVEGIDGNVAPMQGFWVYAKSASNFTFSNAMRSHKVGSAAFRAPQVSERQLMRLQITNGAEKDEAVVLFSENVNSDWNSSKLMNPGLSIYTVKAAENLALNSRTAIEYDVETAVGVKAESGVYTFSASKFENFGAEKAFLVDKAANVATDLSSGDYTVNFTEAYQGTDRFALVFPRSGVISGLENAEATGFFAFANNNRISVNSDAQTGMIYVFNGLGQQVAAQPVSGNLTTVSTALPAGVYLVKLNNLTTKVVVK